MNCRNAEEFLPLYSGGDLPQEKIADLETHLSACADCVAELESYREVSATLAELRLSSAGQPLWESLAPRLRAQDAVRQIRTPWFRRPLWTYVAAAALLFVAGRPFLSSEANPSGELNPDVLASSEPESTESGPPSLVPVPRDELHQLFRNHAVMLRQNDSSAVLVQQASNAPVDF